MEARKITVIQTKNQKKSVIMSSATTLAELKSDLRANGIDYDGMTFFEGTSKVELVNDNSVLPHDVPYKGTVTNELVFMLTNTNKKIRSGAMSRAEAYEAIKFNGLQAACVAKYGKNFTQCSTVALIELVESNTAKKPTTAPKTEPKKAEKAPKTTKEKAPSTSTQCQCGECVDNVARAAISKLVDFLEDNGTIEYNEKEEIINILGGKVAVASVTEDYKPKSASPYSDDEIDEMFADMNR